MRFRAVCAPRTYRGDHVVGEPDFFLAFLPGLQCPLVARDPLPLGGFLGALTAGSLSRCVIGRQAGDLAGCLGCHPSGHSWYHSLAAVSCRSGKANEEQGPLSLPVAPEIRPNKIRVYGEPLLLDFYFLHIHSRGSVGSKRRRLFPCSSDG